jgi:hemerythrin
LEGGNLESNPAAGDDNQFLEECFETYHCPAAEKNKKAHAAFVVKFDKYHQLFRESGGSVEMALTIHEEIMDWIVNHIMIVDGELYPCLPKRPKPAM